MPIWKRYLIVMTIVGSVVSLVHGLRSWSAMALAISSPEDFQLFRKVNLIGWPVIVVLTMVLARTVKVSQPNSEVAEELAESRVRSRSSKIRWSARVVSKWDRDSLTDVKRAAADPRHVDRYLEFLGLLGHRLQSRPPRVAIWAKVWSCHSAPGPTAPELRFAAAPSQDGIPPACDF